MLTAKHFEVDKSPYYVILYTYIHRYRGERIMHSACYSIPHILSKVLFQNLYLSNRRPSIAHQRIFHNYIATVTRLHMNQNY